MFFFNIPHKSKIHKNGASAKFSEVNSTCTDWEILH